MNKFKQDEKVINSDQAKNAQQQEQKVDTLKLGNNGSSHIEEVANLHKKESVNNPEQSEKK